MIFSHQSLHLPRYKFGIIPRSFIPPTPMKNMLYMAEITIFALNLRSQWSLGAVCSCLPFYCINLKRYMWTRGGSV